MENLLNEIHTIFREDQIDSEKIQKVLEDYKCNLEDWRQYIHFDQFT